MRWCNLNQNSQNRKQIGKNNTSGFKGVSLKNNKWYSSIGYNNKKNFIGLFNNKIDAAEAYNQKAIELFGEFANLNIIPDEDIWKNNLI